MTRSITRRPDRLNELDEPTDPGQPPTLKYPGCFGNYKGTPTMTTPKTLFSRSLLTTFASVLTLTASLAIADDVKIKLTGAEEVPPVTTSATGSGTITIDADKAVSGSVKTKGIEGTAAHIHLAALGKNGPPVITLTKGADGEWTVPAGAVLTDAQLASYKAGDLYVNVHSAANKGGEIRAQLKPAK